MNEITEVNVYKGEDDRWYYAAWCGAEHDHNDQIEDAESETEAKEWVHATWPNATVRTV